MVDPYSINSNYFKKIRNIFHQGLVHPRPYRIVRIALAALFIYGGVTKLFDPKAFAATISAYELLPEALLPLLAVGLPLIETIAGLAWSWIVPGDSIDHRASAPLYSCWVTAFWEIWMSIAAASGPRNWTNGPLYGRPFIET